MAQAKRLTHFMADHKPWIETQESKVVLKQKEREISDELRPGDGRPGVMFNWPDNKGFGGTGSLIITFRK